MNVLRTIFRLTLLVSLTVGTFWSLAAPQSLASTIQQEACAGAAKVEKKEATSHMVSTALHGAAAAVCGAACATSAMGVAGPTGTLCMYSSIGAGVGNIIMAFGQKDAGSQVMQGLMSTAMSVVPSIIMPGEAKFGGDIWRSPVNGTDMVGKVETATNAHGNLPSLVKTDAGAALAKESMVSNGMTEAQADKAIASIQKGTPPDQAIQEAAPTKTDLASCIAAGTNTLSAVMQGMAAGKASKAAKENESCVDNLKAAEKTAERGVAFNASLGGGGSAAPGSLAGNGGGTDNATAGTGKTGGSAGCGQATGNTQAFVSCAVAADPNLPPIVSDPKFADEFKKVTGQDLGGFIDSAVANQAPAKDIMAAAFGNLQDANTTRAKVEQLEREIASAESQYLGGRAIASSGSKGKEGSNPIADLFGKKGASTPFGNSQGVALLGINRSPAEVFQDRTLSLFVRVSHRYNSSRAKIEELPYSSPYNKATTR